ncbi:retrovirus-related pol polyprotein from transposon TNT 1-94 [Tanacetum coccineum]
MVKPVWNNAQRVNHQNFAKKTHPCAKMNLVLRSVLMKSGLVSVNIVRQVNAAHSKTTVNAARPMSKTAHSTIKRPIHKNTSFKNSNINQRVNTVRGKNVNTTRPKAVVNAVKGNNVNVVKASACWVWKPKTRIQVSDGLGPQKKLIFFSNVHDNQQMDLQDQGVIDSGCLSVARTPQQNGVAERRNRTLIEAARTMLADSKLPTTFWAEAVNTACYVQNRVLVVKPHNKTPYELFHGRTPTLSFIRPFGCPVTILNTINHLGKFEGKADEGFFVRYSLNSKAFRVFNSRTRIVEENLHIRFSESTPNVVGSGLDWLFDIDALTRTMNYEPIVAGTQSNGFAGTKASDNAVPKSSHDDESKPSSDDGKKVDENSREDSECKDQEKEDNVNSTNNVNVAGTNEVNVVGGKTSIELPFDPNMHALEDYSIFDTSRDDEDDDVEAEMNNLDTTIKIEEEVYVCQPPGFEDPDFPDRVYKMSSMGELTYFLGLQVQQKKDCTFISQDKYVGEILKKFRFTEVKTASTPMETQKPLLKDEDGEEVDVHMYRSMICSLMYLTSSRPDIMFVVCACARNKVNPKVSHLHVVKRIFKYLKSQPKLGLWYPKDSPFDLVAYTDSDIARASLDRKSTTGEHFRSTIKAKTVNGEVQLQALVDGKKIIITESTVRRDLQLEDAEGVDCLPNSTIFE